MILQELIRETIHAYFAANNALDVERFVAAFAPDAVLYNAAETSPLTGHDAVRRVAEQSLHPFSELNATIQNIFFAADGAAVFYTVHLTAKNGRTVTSEGIDVMEINSEGKIQTMRFYIDPAPIAELFA